MALSVQGLVGAVAFLDVIRNTLQMWWYFACRAHGCLIIHGHFIARHGASRQQSDKASQNQGFHDGLAFLLTEGFAGVTPEWC